MRRATLVAVLAAPVLAAAQTTPTAGNVTFSDQWLNGAQCSGTDTTTDVQLSWMVAVSTTITTVPAGSSFQVYASTTAFPAPSTTTQNQVCTGTAGATAVGSSIATTQVSATNQSFAKSDIAVASGVSCAVGSDTPVYVCVQLNTTSGTAIATGTMTLSTKQPAAPVNVRCSPGNEALNVSWDAPSSSTPAVVSYAAMAKPTDPAVDQTEHWSSQVTGTSARISGLVNDRQYTVVAFSYSASGTQSAASTPPLSDQTTIPRPVADFWDYYHAQGGREAGGCGTPAAALSLLGAAALLAARRRK